VNEPPSTFLAIRRIHMSLTENQSPLHLSQRAKWASEQPIGHLMASALARPELISLAAGFVDPATLPIDITRQAFEAMMSSDAEAKTALQYGSTLGDTQLRTALVESLAQADGRTCEEMSLSADQVIITAGSNQLLHLLGDVLFDPGDIVLCAAPTYVVFLGVLTSLGVRSVGIETDSAGIVPESLEETLKQLEQAGELGRVKAIYAVSYSDNPTSATLSVDRRSRLVQLAQQWSREGRIHVIEDVAYRELRYEGSDLPSMRSFDSEGHTVIVAGTFSKSYSPGIRVGWGILPPDLVVPVVNQKGNVDFGSPHFSQRLLAHVLQSGQYTEHVEQLRESYRTKMEAMVAAADRYLAPISGVRWEKPLGGLYVWLELPKFIEAGPSGKLFDLAVEQGMLYVPGEYFYPSEGEPVRKNRIRLSFGVQSNSGIDAGVAALGRAIEQAITVSEC